MNRRGFLSMLGFGGGALATAVAMPISAQGTELHLAGGTRPLDKKDGDIEMDCLVGPRRLQHVVSENITFTEDGGLSHRVVVRNGMVLSWETNGKERVGP